MRVDLRFSANLQQNGQVKIVTVSNIVGLCGDDTITVYGMVSRLASHALRSLLICCVYPSKI